MQIDESSTCSVVTVRPTITRNGKPLTALVSPENATTCPVVSIADAHFRSRKRWYTASDGSCAKSSVQRGYA